MNANETAVTRERSAKLFAKEISRKSSPNVNKGQSITRNPIPALILAVAVTALAPLPAHAIVLTYSTIFETPAKLYDVDTETGLSSVRSVLTIQDDYFAMDTRPSDGKLFLLGRNGDLYTADPNTGVTNWLGKTEIGDNNAAGLTFDPTTGKLYANRNLGYEFEYGLFEISDIDGSTIASYPFGDFRSLEFNSQGELYARGRFDRQLYQFDTGTFWGTPIGAGIVPGEYSLDPLGDGTFVEERLFSVTHSTPSFLYGNDFATGDALHVADLNGATAGLVYLPVPEPSGQAWSAAALFGAACLGRMRLTP